MLMVRCGMVLCSALQLVSRVTVDFDGARFNLFVVNHSWRVFK